MSRSLETISSLVCTLLLASTSLPRRCHFSCLMLQAMAKSMPHTGSKAGYRQLMLRGWLCVQSTEAASFLNMWQTTVAPKSTEPPSGSRPDVKYPSAYDCTPCQSRLSMTSSSRTCGKSSSHQMQAAASYLECICMLTWVRKVNGNSRGGGDSHTLPSSAKSLRNWKEPISHGKQSSSLYPRGWRGAACLPCGNLLPEICILAHVPSACLGAHAVATAVTSHLIPDIHCCICRWVNPRLRGSWLAALPRESWALTRDRIFFGTLQQALDGLVRICTSLFWGHGCPLSWQESPQPSPRCFE